MIEINNFSGVTCPIFQLKQTNCTVHSINGRLRAPENQLLQGFEPHLGSTLKKESPWGQLCMRLAPWRFVSLFWWLGGSWSTWPRLRRLWSRCQPNREHGKLSAGEWVCEWPWKPRSQRLFYQACTHICRYVFEFISVYAITQALNMINHMS